MIFNVVYQANESNRDLPVIAVMEGLAVSKQST
jgi:hypothetical protein